jgi:hypothetical protein
MNTTDALFATMDKEITRNMHTTNKVASLVRDYQGALHGSKDTESRQVEYDIEFPDMFHAAAFAETARRWFASVNVRLGDQVMSLDATVTLTALTK